MDRSGTINRGAKTLFREYNRGADNFFRKKYFSKKQYLRSKKWTTSFFISAINFIWAWWCLITIFQNLSGAWGRQNLLGTRARTTARRRAKTFFDKGGREFFGKKLGVDEIFIDKKYIVISSREICNREIYYNVHTWIIFIWCCKHFQGI